jgi:peptidoglycan hydrolase CwlO-like protein
MTFELEQVIELLVLICSVAAIVISNKNQVANIKEDIQRLEKKQDKHNGLIERMVAVEQSCKSAHHRLDEIKGDK